jgi:hypothetical protein
MTALPVNPGRAGPRPCWICGRPADSSEHAYKARDLKRLLFGKGFGGGSLFTAEGGRVLPGPNSRRVKYKNVICSNCNTTATRASDRAYDRFSDWMVAHQSVRAATLDLACVFGPDYAAEVDQLYRYFAKALGCRLVSQGGVLPSELFPNPVTGTNMKRLKISVCRVERFHSMPDYEPAGWERAMGNGTLHSSHSKNAFDATGRRYILNALWSAHLGHFQTNYWLDVPPNPAFGPVLDASRPAYEVVPVALDHAGVEESMVRWMEENRRRPNATDAGTLVRRMLVEDRSIISKK